MIQRNLYPIYLKYATKLGTKIDSTYKTGLQFLIHLSKCGLLKNITF